VHGADAPGPRDSAGGGAEGRGSGVGGFKSFPFRLGARLHERWPPRSFSRRLKGDAQFQHMMKEVRGNVWRGRPSRGSLNPATGPLPARRGQPPQLPRFGVSLEEFLCSGGFPGAAPLTSDVDRWAAHIVTL
jgi:hypothetical protein